MKIFGFCGCFIYKRNDDSNKNAEIECATQSKDLVFAVALSQSDINLVWLNRLYVYVAFLLHAN